MEQAKDLLSQEIFEPRRSNQKFATRRNQIKYNNIIAKKKRDAKAMMDKALDKNRTTLKRILGNETEVIRSKDFLQGAGLFLTCLTHNINRGEEIYHCVYEYAYTQIDANNYKIIKL